MRDWYHNPSCRLCDSRAHESPCYPDSSCEGCNPEDIQRAGGRSRKTYGQSSGPQALGLAELLAVRLDSNINEALKAEIEEWKTDLMLPPRKQCRVDLRYEPTRCELMSITGADYLAQSIKDRIKAAKERATNALTRSDNAFGKFDGACSQVETVAVQIEKEADNLLAELGQISNGGPAE